MGFRRNLLERLATFGVSPGVTRVALRQWSRYRREAREFELASAAVDADIPMGPPFPVLSDYGDSAGAARGHYFHMDLWAARRIYAEKPARHVDIGSRIDGFIAHLLTFRNVEVLDVRPLASPVPGLTFVQGDATELAGVENGEWESISCLHAAEHFGLGRYGDPIDPLGYRKLIRALSRVLAKDGRLYFAVPVGRERVEFNAHRVFDPLRIVREFEPLQLVAFHAIDDAGDFHADASPEDFRRADYACGLYEFTQPRT